MRLNLQEFPSQQGILREQWLDSFAVSHSGRFRNRAQQALFFCERGSDCFPVLRAVLTASGTIQAVPKETPKQHDQEDQAD